MAKDILKSKRFWSGLISLLTGVSFILTGEKAWDAMAGELLLTAIGLVQTVIALTSNKTVTVGGRPLN